MLRKLFLVLGVGLAGSPAYASTVAQCVVQKLEPSLAVIAQMNAAGLDPAKARTVSQLFLGRAAALDVAKPNLVRLGSKIELDPNSGRLLAFADVIVSEAWVRRAIPVMCEIAAKAGAEYDGWDVDVASDNIKSKANN